MVIVSESKDSSKKKDDKKKMVISLKDSAKDNFDKNVRDLEANAKSLKFGNKIFKGSKTSASATVNTDDGSVASAVKDKTFDSKHVHGRNTKVAAVGAKGKMVDSDTGEVDIATVAAKHKSLSVGNSGISSTRAAVSKQTKRFKIKEDVDMSALRKNYLSPEYRKLVGEFFDINDRDTRLILTAVDEDDQDKVIMSLTGKIYNNMIDKIDDIDFGDIPATKGDITELPNYKKMCECISLMTELLDRFKESKDTIDIVSEALHNIESRTAMWKKGFSLNLELPMVTYDTIVLAIIESTSFLVSMCVEFIKSPSQDTFTITIDKSRATKSKQHLLLDNLKKFNAACKNGTIDNTMNYIMKGNVKNFAGFATGTGAVFGVVGIAGLLLVIIPILRELIFLFYYQRVRIADYFETQADLLEMNAYNVQNNNATFTKEERKAISNKQMAIATKFRKVSDFVAVDAKSAEVNATKEIANNKKKYKADEVMDEVPDSAAAALF